MSIDRKQPDDVGAESSHGWDEVGDEEASRDAEATDVEMLLTDAALAPDDPAAGEAARRGADPDLGVETDRGEEP